MILNVQFIFSGFLLDKKIGVNQPKRLEKASILIANTPMDTDKIKVKIAYDISMPPTLKKLMGHIAFGACVGGWVRACVGHTFCTYCNF